jgi:clan AA aspartic protease (TIGR02281 family)
MGPKVVIDETPGATPGTIDLRRSQTGHLLVPVHLGDQDYDFILDTGASITVITPDTRDRLGIDAEDGIPVKAAGANGEIDQVRVVNLPPVRVAGREHQGLQAAVMQLEHLEGPLGRSLPGILGQNFLATHRLELDFPANTVVFHPESEDAPEIPDSTTVPWEAFEVAGLIRLRVSIDDSEPFPAVLDLGAGRSIVNWKAAALAGVDPKDELSSSAEPLLGADAKALQLKTRAFKNLRFGEVAIEGPQLYIGDVGVFETLGISDGPAMVLGVDLLSDRRLLIDYPAKTLVVSTRN